MESAPRRIFRLSFLIVVTTLTLSRNIFLRPLLRLRRALFKRLRKRIKAGKAPSGPAAPPKKDFLVHLGRINRRLAPVVHRLEHLFDRFKNWAGPYLDRTDPMRIITFRGYGTAEKLYLKGRVIEDNGIEPARAEDPLWRNFINTYKRFESDEIPGARVRASFYGKVQETTTNEEGYFEVWLEPDRSLPTDRLWHEVELELIPPRQPPCRTTGYVLVAPPSSRFGIISDVDDTVVQTDATSLFKMARTVFLGNARTRLPFKGVAGFYQALQAGAQGNEFNPLFYVSSSPWNLYDLLTEFMELEEIPLGPLMLRDWGISQEEILPIKHGPHKMKSIRQILDTFAPLPFILIGDSGQEDPEIYYEILKEYPERILAIYIRNVSPTPRRPNAIRALAEEVKAAGSTLILADDTYAAALHALTQGWIAESALPHIQVEQAKDQPPSEAQEADESHSVVVEGKEI